MTGLTLRAMLCILVVSTLVHALNDPQQTFKTGDKWDNYVTNESGDEQPVRDNNIIYAPATPPPDGDRFGREFIHCHLHDKDETDMKGRCYRGSGLEEPVCAVTHDFSNNSTRKWCFSIQKDTPEICSDNCTMTVNARSFGGRPYYKQVGFCCCRLDMCNMDSDHILANAQFRLPPVTHHHHHHRQNFGSDQLNLP